MFRTAARLVRAHLKFCR